MAALVLIDDGCVVARGGESIGRALGRSELLMRRFRSGSAVVMEEAAPSEISLHRVLLSLPRDVAVLVAAALRVGIDIGVNDAEDMAVVQAGLDCCEGQSLDGRFWDRVAAVEGLFGEECTGAMTDAVMAAIASVGGDNLVGVARDLAAADVRLRTERLSRPVLGAAFAVAA